MPEIKCPLLHFETEVYAMGYKRIAGVDEAGRGPLAGPVVAAACIIPEGLILEDVDDSKKIPPEKRKSIYLELINHPQIEFGVGIVDVKRIDEINILQATFEAMLLAVKELAIDPDYLLIDGNRLPKTQFPMKGIIKGDSRSQSIAAASIIAKETRDAIMYKYHEKYPEYQFDLHKGYATQKHLIALQTHGPSPIHRHSFEPVKSLLLNNICS